MILENNPFGTNLLNDLLERNLSLEDFTTEAEKHGVHVLQPGEITTCEVRGDNSRYFPEVDDSGVVTGGHFG